jgi:hypothetical protein
MGKQHYAAVIALLLLGGIPAAGQETTANPGATAKPTVPGIKLSAEQRQTIYASINNQKQKETAPATFIAQVGAVVPTTVELQPMPKTIVELIPELKDYEYAMVTNQVLLVDPKSKQVVEIIN